MAPAASAILSVTDSVACIAWFIVISIDSLYVLSIMPDTPTLAGMTRTIANPNKISFFAI